MKAFLFDLDGTLIDSTGIWGEIDVEFLNRRGFDVPPDYARDIGHLRFDEVADYTIRRFDLKEDPGDLIKEWNEMAIEAYRTQIPMKPGAKDYLLALKETGAKLALVTSSAEPLREAVIRRHGIRSLFDIICSTDEVSRGKEFPDIYLYAAKLMDVDPGHCLVFEDILPAVKAAKKAGMYVCAVYDKASGESWDEIKRTADRVLYDFSEAPLPTANFT